MSTSNKLTYLNETKNKIKSAINLTGANITSDTFRQYHDKLYSKFLDILKNGTSTLKGNMPRVTGTGTELTLNNTSDLGMDLSLSASESTQFTTTGKNLFNGVFSNTTSNGITATFSDGILTLNGTATAQTDINHDGTLTLKANTAYTIKSFLVSGSVSGTGTIAKFFFQNSSNWKGFDLDITNSDSSQTKSAEYVGNGLTLSANKFIRAYNGASFNNFKIKIQIEEGSTATDYEPYTGAIPSPNPDFPQNVNVVTGNNSILIDTNKTFDKSNILNAILSDSGTLSSNNSWYTLILKVKPNTTYTINKTATSAFRVAEFETTPQIGDTYNNRIKDDLASVIVYTTSANGNYLAINYANSSATAPEVRNSINFKEGINYAINLSSLELAKIGDYADKIFNNIPSNPLYDSTLVEGGWYKYKVINKLVLNGTETWEAFLNNTRFACYITNISNKTSEAGTRMIYSNYFRGIKFDDRGTDTNNTIYLVSNGYANTSAIIINIPTAKTPEEYKSFLGEILPKVYFPLATPINEQITDTTLISQLEVLKNATSYDDQTNISQTNADRPFVISASAIKNSME